MARVFVQRPDARKHRTVPEWVRDWVTGDAVPPEHKILQRVFPISSRALRWIPRVQNWEGTNWCPSYLYVIDGWVFVHLVRPVRDIPLLGPVVKKLYSPLCYLDDVSIGVYNWKDPDGWIEVTKTDE